MKELILKISSKIMPSKKNEGTYHIRTRPPAKVKRKKVTTSEVEGIKRTL